MNLEGEGSVAILVVRHAVAHSLPLAHAGCPRDVRDIEQRLLCTPWTQAHLEHKVSESSGWG